MSDITISTGKNLVPGGGDDGSIVNRWKQVIAVAQPTFDAVIRLRDARAWLEEHQRYPTLMLDLDDFSEANDAEAKAKLALIPEVQILKEDGQLFDLAVRKSAPEAWFHLALGCMLASMTNGKKVATDYQYAIVDMLLRDEGTFEQGCEPGFSAPIFVDAIRKLRREEEFVPTAAKLLKACQHQRGRYRTLFEETETLIQVRQNAKMIIFDEEKFQEDFGDWPDDDTDKP